jgi:hypothetical protein
VDDMALAARNLYKLGFEPKLPATDKPKDQTPHSKELAEYIVGYWLYRFTQIKVENIQYLLEMIACYEGDTSQ